MNTKILQLLIALLFTSAGLKAQTWDERPVTSFNTTFEQDFTTGVWDGPKLYNQWDVIQPNIFTATDIEAGYLQFKWIEKRILTSKLRYPTPYVIEAETNYEGGSNRGGVVIRVNPVYDEQVQEPAQGDPGFNSEGIAFYPAEDGQSMIVQFTGTYAGSNTPVTRINVPKPAGVESLMNRGVLRIEDFGTSVYVFYNHAPFIRIDLDSKTGNIFSSGTVYNADMSVAGTFVGMEVEEKGKISICQRDAALKLYDVKINYNELTEQSISFNVIGKKKNTDSPFELMATASSDLPVTFTLISGPATVDGSTVTLSGQSGIVNIAANQTGNDEYYAANQVIRSFYVSDANAINTPSTSQDYVDNWVVTDALGRQLPTHAQVGDQRDDKLVGVFYYTWHGYHGNKVYDIPTILANYPSDPLSADNNAWGGPGAFHFWGEPETGYHRAEDPWVLRRDLQMLSNAHVDFLYFDVTNAITYLETIKALCEMSMKMRAEGIYTPQIAFTTHNLSGKVMNRLYDEFYANELFDDLWFIWDGKPLILGDANDAVLRPEVKDFFTIKFSWAWTNTKNEPNHWQWLDEYPQDYGWSDDINTPEQVVVSVASHPNNTKGTSYSNGAQPPLDENYLTAITGQGHHFAEQWTRALELDPEVIMVTQWNEWLAQRFIWENGSGTYAGKPIKNGDSYFVDVFTEEFNRDMAPMKGGHTDNFYYQLVANIRKFKGMKAPEVIADSKTMSIDGVFTEWSDVTPAFKDPIGDVMHRNFAGYDPTVTYINTTGRNDIIESRISYDSDNVYFYVKTVDAITAHDDPNWMLLFIDADRNKSTGWQGYDYVINQGSVSSTNTTLKQWTGIDWSNETPIPYALSGVEMEIGVPRAALHMTDDMPEFYFKWADNPQHLNDITAFFTDGESAPDRRFNYNYSATAIEVTEQSPYKELNIPGIIELEDFDNGSAGIAYADATLGNSGGAYRTDESVDIKEKTANAYYITDIYNNEWLEYTVNVNATGLYTAEIHYSADGDNQSISLLMDNEKISTLSLAKTGTENDWSVLETDVRIKTGTQVFKLMAENVTGGLHIDKIVFTEKDVVYPDDGTGLYRTFYNGDIGGRKWFTETFCSEVDPEVNHDWNADESPGCGTRGTFWNARWEGELEPHFTEAYTISLTANHMSKLWINEELIIDAWSYSEDQTNEVTINLTANEKVPIKIEYANYSGDGSIKLEWESASQVKEVIPQSQLFPGEVLSIGDSHLAKSLIHIYPNPASNTLYIKAAEPSKIEIFNLLGQKVYQLKARTGVNELNISDWKSGMYLINIEYNQEVFGQKLIIK